MARLPLMMLLPPAIFAAVAGLLIGGMYFGNGGDLPSTLIGQQAPAVPAEPLPGKPLLSDADLRGGAVTLVNFWASWCPPCRAEHPVLMQMAEEGIRVAGVNLRDATDQALDYLADEGDPFLAHGFDPRGRSGIDWGVTAPPETFIVAGDGTILFRFAGPLIGSDYEARFLPALQEALGE